PVSFPRLRTYPSGRLVVHANFARAEKKGQKDQEACRSVNAERSSASQDGESRQLGEMQAERTIFPVAELWQRSCKQCRLFLPCRLTNGDRRSCISGPGCQNRWRLGRSGDSAHKARFHLVIRGKG